MPSNKYTIILKIQIIKFINDFFNEMAVKIPKIRIYIFYFKYRVNNILIILITVGCFLKSAYYKYEFQQLINQLLFK